MRETPDPRELFCHLSSAVGHKLVNALSTIVSQAEILRNLSDPPDEARAELDLAIDSIIKTALDAALLTQRAMDCAHEAVRSADSGLHERDWQEVHLDRLVADFAAAERARLGPDVSLDLELAPVPAIKGQAHVLRYMLAFLIQNAIESTEGRAGTITLRTFVEPDGRAVVEVRDDGTGMSEDAQERATDPFYTTKPEHRGIGLTIARSIWRRHRGFMVIESAPGQGTTVRLTAPGIGRP